MKKLFSLLLIAGIALTGCGSANKDTEKEVTGKIHIYTRDASSGTREAFETLVDFKEKLAQTAIEVSANGDMATKVGADLNGIGYVSLTTDFAANNITPVKYKGVEATVENTLNGTYELQRPFKFVSRAKGDYENERIEQLVAAFIDYMQNSIEGREVVAGAHGIVDVDAGTPWDELKAKHPIVDQDNSDLTIKTGGSTSVEKTLKAALESFVGLAGNFNFEMNQTGSSDGYKRTLGSEKDGANKVHIGFASREFKAEEDVTKAEFTGAYALDAVVAVVNAKNKKFNDIDQDTLAKIFKGEITNWEDIK